MTAFRGVAAFLLACLCAVPARSAPATAQPAPPAAVRRELVDVPGAGEPHTPAAYNRALAFRYFLPGAPAPSAVVILIPGLNSGPNTQDILARGLLASHGPGLEVWVTVPRPTLLQDRRGVEAALLYGNPDFALGYYYGTLAIEGHRFRLLDGSEVPFMAYWGLDVHLRDIRATVREIQRRAPGARLVLGGHSLGGVMAAAYAGYDFAQLPGDPPVLLPSGSDVGAGDLAGLLFIDGLPLRIALRVTPARYLHGFRIPFGPRFPGVANLLDPDPAKRRPPFTRTHRIARTRDSILLDVVSLYAFLRPGQASRFPYYPRVSRHGAVRITNDALVAAIFSDRMERDAFVRANVEVPLGVFSTVPDPANIRPEGLLDLASGIPAPGETLIRLPEQAEPPPRVPIRELLAAILRPGADFTEWYFPWRLVLDVGLAASGGTDAFAQQYFSLTRGREIALPMLILGAGHGLVRSEGATAWFRSVVRTPHDRVAVRIFSTLSHLDIEDADPNPAVPVILSWLQSVIH